MTGSDTARFTREWNVAFGLVTALAALLLAAGYVLPGVVAAGLCGAAVLARWRAMHRQGRGFYGQDKQAR